MNNFSVTALNPKANNIPGATIFEGYGPGRCNCSFASNYPYAIGPRVGAAYQVTPKTVLRAGFGIVYSKTANNSFVSQFGVGSSNQFISPGLNQPAMYLKNGIPVTPVWRNFDPGQQPAFVGTVGTAPTLIDHNAGRPPRQMQWSIGIQRELSRNLAIDVLYVGNRGLRSCRDCPVCVVSMNSISALVIFSPRRTLRINPRRSSMIERSLTSDDGT
jgi:hypothetical protein